MTKLVTAIEAMNKALKKWGEPERTETTVSTTRLGHPLQPGASLVTNCVRIQNFGETTIYIGFAGANTLIVNNEEDTNEKSS
jgi:hypothetical protein